MIALSRKDNRVQFFVTTVLISVLFTMLAGWLAVSIARTYYQFAPFHFDSSSYLSYALAFADTIQSQGKLTALLQSVFCKDSLDISLRILFAPAALKTTFGHMVVLLPFMGLFIFLTLYYVLKQTHSWLSSITVISFLFAFPFIYTPYMGIADYWKESIAIWMLGSAVVSWLLSEALVKKGWAILCGVLLGLLVMQRSALAVYTAIIFFPLVMQAAYQRFRQDDKTTALLRVNAFVIPASLLCILVALTQWETLYNYYFVAGYAYSSPFKVIKTLSTQLVRGFLLPVFLVASIGAFCFYINSEWQKQKKDILTMLWLVMSYPLVIIFTKGLYHSFCTSWSVLLVIFLATLIPINLPRSAKKTILFLTLLTVALLSSITQYWVATTETGAVIRKYISFTPFYDKLLETMLKEPQTKHFALLYAEDEVRFLDHARLKRAIPYNRLIPIAHVYSHDTYYKSESASGEIDVKQIAQENIQRIEKFPNALVVAYCDTKNIPFSPAYEEDGISHAMPIAAYQAQYFADSPYWQAIKKIISPYGCVYVYRHANVKLTDYAKWQAVA